MSDTPSRADAATPPARDVSAKGGRWRRVLARLEPATATAAAVRWGAAPQSVKLVSRSANVVYRATADGTDLYLRLTHAELRGPAELEPPLALLRHAAAGGAQVCRPLPSREGRYLEKLVQEDDTFYATAVAAAPGKRLEPWQLNPTVAHAWGQALATLHRAADAFVPAPEHRYHHWRAQWRGIAPKVLGDRELAAVYHQLGTWLGQLPEGSESRDFGLTHADYRAGNAAWDGRQVTIFDFDEPTWCWYAYDIARALLEHRERPPAERATLQAAFLAGYRRVRPLAPAWDAALPQLMRFRALLMYGWWLEDRLHSKDDPYGGSGAFIGELRRWLLASDGR